MSEPKSEGQNYEEQVRIVLPINISAAEWAESQCSCSGLTPPPEPSSSETGQLPGLWARHSEKKAKLPVAACYQEVDGILLPRPLSHAAAGKLCT